MERPCTAAAVGPHDVPIGVIICWELLAVQRTLTYLTLHLTLLESLCYTGLYDNFTLFDEKIQALDYVYRT